MKITSREQTLWFVVGFAIILMLGYSFISNNRLFVENTAEQPATMSEARRLLAAGANIKNRHQAVNDRLRQVQSYFLKGMEPEDQRIRLLETVESLVETSGLNVERKNVIDFRDGLLAVSLEGTTASGPFFTFMHQAAIAPLGLELKRVQIMANPETKQLKYQLIVVTKIIGKTGETQ